MAMAAPTPISALVHSSTLVTAGLYLIMRFSVLFYSFPSLIKVFLVISIYTSFYAGVRAVFEVDIKKVIALSTLRHLGFIGIAFSVGLLHLAYFHIFSHALFKSLLFIRMGEIILRSGHHQDRRAIGSGGRLTPVSLMVINVSAFKL